MRLRLRKSSDVVALVPYLLGFHPRDSLVAVLLAAGRVRLTARMDLRDDTPMPVLAAELTRIRARVGASDQILLGFGDVPVRARLQELADLVGPETLDVLGVTGDRFWSLLGPEGACPEEGTPYDPGCHPLVAEAVLAGLSASPGRNAVEAMVAGPAEDRRADLERLAADAAAELAGRVARGAAAADGGAGGGGGHLRRAAGAGAGAGSGRSRRRLVRGAGHRPRRPRRGVAGDEPGGRGPARRPVARRRRSDAGAVGGRAVVPARRWRAG